MKQKLNVLAICTSGEVIAHAIKPKKKVTNLQSRLISLKYSRERQNLFY